MNYLFHRLIPISALAAVALAAGLACQPQPAAPTTPAATAAPATGTTPAATAPAAAATMAPSTGATAVPPAAKPTVPQRLTVLVPNVFGDLNLYNKGNAGCGVYCQAISEALTTSRTGKTEAQLAQSWTAVNPTTWEFTLRPNLRFNDGTPVTAQDVAESINTGKDRNLATVTVATFLVTVDQATAPSANVVRVTTTEPDPILPNKVGAIPVLPMARFAQQGAEAFHNNPMSIGQFILERFQAQQEVVVRANPDYYGPKPVLEQITFKSVPEPAARVAALRAGEGLLAGTLLQDQFGEVRSANGRIAIVTTPVMTTIFLDTTTPEYADVRVRRALNIGIDRDLIARDLLENLSEVPQGQPLPVGSYGFNPALQKWTFNQDQASALVREVFPSGFATQIGFTSTQATFRLAAEALTPYLQRMGIRAETAPYDAATFSSGFLTNRLGPAVISAVSQGELADPGSSVGRISGIPGVGSTRWNNEPYNVLYRQQAVELDADRRERILQDMMVILNQEAPIIPLWSFWNAWGVAERMGTFELYSNGLPDWTTVSIAR